MTTTVERKSEAINLRMSPSTKDLLRQVADREHRTLSNMLEVLIHERAELLGIDAPTRTGRAPRATRRRG